MATMPTNFFAAAKWPGSALTTWQMRIRKPIKIPITHYPIFTIYRHVWSNGCRTRYVESLPCSSVLHAGHVNLSTNSAANVSHGPHGLKWKGNAHVHFKPLTWILTQPSSSTTPKQCKGLWFFCKEQCFLTSSHISHLLHVLLTGFNMCKLFPGVSSSHGCTAPGKREAKIEINCARKEGLKKNRLVESRPIWKFSQHAIIWVFSKIGVGPPNHPI